MTDTKHPAEMLADYVAEHGSGNTADVSAMLRRIPGIEAEAAEMHRMYKLAMDSLRMVEAERDKLRAEIEVLRADAKRMTWQPIATAPRETELLVGRLVNSSWRICQSGLYLDSGNDWEGEPSYWYWHCDWDSGGGVTEGEGPTHWMPLPPAIDTARGVI